MVGVEWEGEEFEESDSDQIVWNCMCLVRELGCYHPVIASQQGFGSKAMKINKFCCFGS